MAQFISSASGASHPEPGGGIYRATVVAVKGNRQVAVKVPMLGVTVDNCPVVFSTPKQPLRTGESVLCCFVDHGKNNLIVIGAIDRTRDVFTLQTFSDALENEIDTLQSQVATLQSQVATLQSQVTALQSHTH